MNKFVLYFLITIILMIFKVKSKLQILVWSELWISEERNRPFYKIIFKKKQV